MGIFAVQKCCLLVGIPSSQDSFIDVQLGSFFLSRSVVDELCGVWQNHAIGSILFVWRRSTSFGQWPGLSFSNQQPEWWWHVSQSVGNNNHRELLRYTVEIHLDHYNMMNDERNNTTMLKGMNGTSELECTTTWKGVRYQNWNEWWTIEWYVPASSFDCLLVLTFRWIQHSLPCPLIISCLIRRCLKTEYAPLSLPRMKVRRGFVLWLSSCQCAALVLSVGVWCRRVPQIV